MNDEEWAVFSQVAHLCYHRDFGTINVASKLRSAAIWAAYLELLEARKQKRQRQGVHDFEEFYPE